MPVHLSPKKSGLPVSLKTILNPLRHALSGVTPFKSGSNRPLKMTLEEQLTILVYFHLNDYKFGRHILQALEQDEYLREMISLLEIIWNILQEAQ